MDYKLNILNMKTIFLFLALICVLNVFAVERTNTLTKVDSCVKQVVKIDTVKINNIVNYAAIADSDKAKVKDIVKDIPEGAKKAEEIVQVLQNQKSYSDYLEFLITLISSIVGFLVFLSGIVKKVRALPRQLSPIYWFEKMMGKNKAMKDGVKGSYVKTFVPDEIKTEIPKV